MFKWVGLILAIGGGITAIVAGFNSKWEVAIIGGIIFVVGIFAMSSSRSGGKG